nr:MAG TPA: YopX protein [Caudoviricetes sp.]
MCEVGYRAWSEEHDNYCDFVTLDRDGQWLGWLEIWIETRKIFLTTTDVIIEQSTDIKDKNGELIHVGDIVKMKYPYDKRYIGKFVVVKDPNSPRIGLLDETKTDEIFDLYNHMSNHYEVIGNIHENTELLNKDQPNEKE